MELEDRLFVRNKDMWLNDCKHDWRYDYTPKVFEVENGIILPAKIIDRAVSYYAGGVCDENFNFKAGADRSVAGRTWGGVGESYTVSKNDLTYINETVVFGGVLMGHFGHVVIDNLTRLWWQVQYRENNYRYCFIMSKGEFKEWMYDFFELLEIDRSRVMIVDKPTQFSKVIVPEEAAHYWQWYTDEWELPYNLMAENALKRVNVEKLPKKIYLTKRLYEVGDTITINEEYFENFYKSQGYEVIAPEQLPVYQQIALAANADAIATTLGTTSQFNLFSKKGTRIDILTRTDYQTIRAQAKINQMKKADFYIIDASMNYLPCDRIRGPIYLDKSNEWKEFAKKKFNVTITEDNIDPLASYEYLKAWTECYVSHQDFFNVNKIGELGGYDFLERMSRIILNKEPDRSKYNLQNSPQQLKATINQLQKSAEENKKQLENTKTQSLESQKQSIELQKQLDLKAQYITQLESEKAQLLLLNKELESKLNLYNSITEENSKLKEASDLLKSVIESTENKLMDLQGQFASKNQQVIQLQKENADLQSDNNILNNKIKERVAKYTELLNNYVKLSNDLVLFQNAKDSDIKSLQGENKTLLQENRSLQKKNGEYAATILKDQSEIADYNSRIIHLEKSLSFRLGRVITFIPRKIRDLFRKKK